MTDEILLTDRPEAADLGRWTLHGRHLCVTLVLLIVGMLLAYQVRIPYEVRLGEEGDNCYLEGFYEPESNPYDVYRWSAKNGVIRFPSIGTPQALTLHLRMNGARPEEIPLPQVVLKVNGQELTRLTPEGQMKIYNFRIPGQMVRWSGDLDLQIDSETFSATGGDRRKLGLMVDWVTVVPQHEGVVIPSPLPLASLVIAGTIVALPLKGKRLPKEVVVVAVVGLPVAAGLLFAFHRIQAARWSWQFLLLAGAGYLGFITLDGIRAMRGVLGETRRLTIAILLLAFLIQVALLAPHFHEGYGVWTYKNWLWHTNTVSLRSLYFESWALAQPVYPPVSLYIFHFIGWVYQSLVAPIPPPSQEPTVSLSFLIRLPSVICNVLLALTVYFWVQRTKGPRWAHLAMAAFAFNPAVALHTTRWGHIDAIHSLFVLVAVLCAISDKPALSWALITLGVAAKPQALLFAPILLVLTWRTSGRKGLLMGILAAASVTVLVMSPFIHSGTWKDVIEYFASLPQYDIYATDTTHNAHNLWWLVGLGKSFPANDAPWNLSLPVVGPLTYEMIGLSLLVLAILFALWRLANVRTGGSIWAVLAYVAFALFMLPTKVHENYTYTVFPLLAMALFVSKPLTAIFLTLSGTWLLNLVFQDPVAIDFLGPGCQGTLATTMTGIGRMLYAVLNTAVLILWTVLLTRVKRRENVEDTEVA